MRGLSPQTALVEDANKRNMPSKRIAYYLRSCGNLHYFASLKPYLDYFQKESIHKNFLVVHNVDPKSELSQEYSDYKHLFTTDCNLDAYDLVLTPTFLRDHEQPDRNNVVQIFHGMSDKPFTYERDFNNYRLCLCAGQRQVDRFLYDTLNRDMRWVKIGYPKFDRPATAPEIFRNNKKTLIYCPTWRKGGISSIDLFLNNSDLLDRTLKAYNLIVKPHPNIFNRDRKFYDEGIVNRLRQVPGIKLFRSGNVMPLFARSDLYIGDISASGYEWLYFNRPMIFLNPDPGVLRPSSDFKSITYLWQCGDVCNDIGQLKGMIDKNLRNDRHRDIRETILRYSVFNPRDNSATKRGIQQIELLLCSRNQV